MKFGKFKKRKIESSPARVEGLENRSLLSSVYFVSPSGNDNNSGTSLTAAWKSVARANQQTYHPGDFLLFQGGVTFSGKLVLTAADAGTRTSPVTVSSFGTGRQCFGHDRGHADLQQHHLHGTRENRFTDRDSHFAGDEECDHSQQYFRHGQGARCDHKFIQLPTRPKQEGDPHRIAFKRAQDRGRTIADSSEKSSDSGKGAAKSAAIDPELAALVASWPALPAIIKSAIIAVANQHLTER